MKRKIKFRAWDSKDKKMFDPIHDVVTFAFNLKCEWIEIMQFTGLKDKNGKEIYEGDIISPVMMCGTITSGTVIFHSGSFMAKQIGAEWLMDDLYRYDYIEVIGNIYENPELLLVK